MVIYDVIASQYPITVNDSVEPVSYSEDCALVKLVPDSLPDEAASSKGERNTTPQHQKNLSYRPLGRDFTQHTTMAHQQKGLCSSRHTKIKEVYN